MVCLVLVMLFPIGLFVGALTNLSVAVCGDGSNDIYWAWFCEGSDGAKVVKAILTGRPRLMQNAAASAECSLHAHGRRGGARGGGGGTRHCLCTGLPWHCAVSCAATRPHQAVLLPPPAVFLPVIISAFWDT